MWIISFRYYDDVRGREMPFGRTVGCFHTKEAANRWLTANGWFEGRKYQSEYDDTPEVLVRATTTSLLIVSDEF